MKTVVVNLTKIYKLGPNDVYIGRGGKGQNGYFGNPFTGGTRSENIAQFRTYFSHRMATDPEFKRRVDAMKGKRLVCFCAPLPCHGEVYAEYLNRELKPPRYDEVWSAGVAALNELE